MRTGHSLPITRNPQQSTRCPGDNAPCSTTRTPTGAFRGKCSPARDSLRPAMDHAQQPTLRFFHCRGGRLGRTARPLESPHRMAHGRAHGQGEGRTAGGHRDRLGQGWPDGGGSERSTP